TALKTGDAMRASFVLDAARFIEAHAYGRTFHNQERPWRIEPLLEQFSDKKIGMLEEATLKGDITRALTGTVAAIRVPPGCCIRDNETLISLVDCELTAYVTIERCHLTGDFGASIQDSHAWEADPPQHDVSEEFRLRGKLLPVDMAEHLLQIGRYGCRWPKSLPVLNVPGRWITSYWTRQSRSEGAADR